MWRGRGSAAATPMEVDDGLTAEVRRWLLGRLTEWRLLTASHIEALLALRSSDRFRPTEEWFRLDLVGCRGVDGETLAANKSPLAVCALTVPGGWSHATAAAVIARCRTSLVAIDVPCNKGILDAVCRAAPPLRQLVVRANTASSKGDCNAEDVTTGLCVLIERVADTLIAVDVRGCSIRSLLSGALGGALSRCHGLRTLALPPTVDVSAVFAAKRDQEALQKGTSFPSSLTEIACGTAAPMLSLVSGMQKHHQQLTVIEFSAAIDDAQLAAVAEASPLLCSLFVADAGNITGTCLVQLERSCRKLKRLVLHKARSLCDSALRSWAAECCVETGTATATPTASATTAKKKKERAHVEELEVTGAMEASGNVLAQVLRAMGGALRVLDLAGAFKADDSTMAAIGEECAELESLDLTMCNRISDEGVRAVARGCRELRELGLYSCTLVGAAGVSEVAELCARGRPEFANVLLYGLHGVTSAAVAALARNAPGLRSVDLSSCPGIDDEALVAMGECCPRLERLLLIGDAAVGDRGLCAVARGCVFLRHLMINGCSLVTDLLFHQLARHSLCLESLSAVGCDRLGQQNGLVALVMATHRTLVKVRLSSTSNVSAHVVVSLRSQFPSLHLLMV